MKTDTSSLEIIKSTTSKLDQTKLDKLVFGEIFTDHMLECDYENEKGNTPRLKPKAPMELMPPAKIFLKGQAVFKGRKYLKDEEDKIWVFRPEENFKGINEPGERFVIPDFQRSNLFNGLGEL